MKNRKQGFKTKTSTVCVVLKQSHTLFQLSNQYSELLREIPKIIQFGWTTWQWRRTILHRCNKTFEFGL